MVQNEMKHVKELFSAVLLITLLVNGLLLVFVDSGLAQAPGVIVVIGSDTTWTKADSPHDLTGPLLINQGVTLTIEAGATVNLAGDTRVSEGATLKIEPGAIFDLKNHDLLINGTLRIKGSSSEKIYLKTGGSIDVTPYGNGWNDQTGSGCIIENAVLEKTDIFTSVPLKMSNVANVGGYIYIDGDSLIILNNNISGQISAGRSSIIQGNTLSALSITGGSVVVSNNTISVLYDCFGSPEISNNFISSISNNGGGSGGSPIISNNNIGSIGTYSNIRDEIMYFSTDSSIITNNIIRQELYLAASSATISNNTFLGFVHGENLIGTNFIHHLGFSPIISFRGNGGSTEISHNKITGHTYNYLWEYNMPWKTVVNDTVTTSGINIAQGSVDVINNTITNCRSGISGGKLIEGNLLTNNRYGVSVYGDDVVIRHNIVTNGENGITINGGTAIIENNLVSNHSDYGISVSGQATIQNNTISDTTTAIKLSDCHSAAINYNNIENYHNNSIYLWDTSSIIDATNNWWGTTDTQAINLSIRDYKYEFDLGRVNFVPFLTEPNPEEMSTPIPEFPPWMLLPLFLTATFAVVAVRKKIMDVKCTK